MKNLTLNHCREEEKDVGEGDAFQKLDDEVPEVEEDKPKDDQMEELG